MIHPFLLTIRGIQFGNIERLHGGDGPLGLLRKGKDLIIEVLSELAESVNVIGDVKDLPELCILNDPVLLEGEVLHLRVTMLLAALLELLVRPLDDGFAGAVDAVLQGIDVYGGSALLVQSVAVVFEEETEGEHESDGHDGEDGDSQA
jgi:hypothetical protein